MKHEGRSLVISTTVGGTTVRFFDGGQPFPMYKGPWGGRYILRSRDAVPMEQASGMHLSIKEKKCTHTQTQTHYCWGRPSINASKALYIENNFSDNRLLKLS